jgi:hypothetical protein
VNSTVYCPTCGVCCKLPIPGPVSVLVRFLNDFERDHKHTIKLQVSDIRYGATTGTRP